VGGHCRVAELSLVTQPGAINEDGARDDRGETPSDEPGQPFIIIDPGHGGSDPGAIGASDTKRRAPPSRPRFRHYAKFGSGCSNACSNEAAVAATPVTPAATAIRRPAARALPRTSARASGLCCFSAKKKPSDQVT
jgi:hypothetical protein